MTPGHLITPGLDGTIHKRTREHFKTHKTKAGRLSAQIKVAQARLKAVSTKSATPTGVMTATGKKDVRSILEEQVDQVMGGGRV